MDFEKELTSARIMIVDDDKATLQLLQLYLKLSGFINVKCIADSRNVIMEYMKFKPDLIVLDLLMPHLDGFAILEKLNAMKSQQHNVLVLTALNDPKTRSRALEAGAKDFLLKPFSREQAVSRIERLIRARNSMKQMEKTDRELGEIIKSLQADLSKEKAKK